MRPRPKQTTISLKRFKQYRRVLRQAWASSSRAMSEEEVKRLFADLKSAETEAEHATAAAEQAAAAAEQATTLATSIKRKLLAFADECVVITSAALDSAKKARADIIEGKHSFHIPNLISNIVSLLLLATSQRLLASSALNFEEQTDPEEERKAIGETARGEASEDARNKKQEQELRQQEWLSVCLFYFSYSVYINNQYLL